MTATFLPPSAAGRVVLVHDWLNQRGGAEFVLDCLHELCERPPVYTSLYQPENMPRALRDWDIHCSFLNRLPGVHALHRYLLPFYPTAFARMNLSDWDLVVSIKSAFCLGVETSGDTRRARHICYCLTPTRFLWNFDAYAERESMPPAARGLSRRLMGRMRSWEVRAAQRVDRFIAISRAVQERIRSCYGRESDVIPPPVNTAEFTPLQSGDSEGDYYLIVSRLVPYKRIDLAISAFQALPDRKLLIVGSGRAENDLRRLAGPNVTFAGYQGRREMVGLVRNCRAFLFPGEEDFGISPVEAMAAGRPVIAFKAGGALDYVEEGKTGVFFEHQCPEALAEKTLQSEGVNWDRELICRAAQRFGVEKFQMRMGRAIREALQE